MKLSIRFFAFWFDLLISKSEVQTASIILSGESSNSRMASLRCPSVHLHHKIVLLVFDFESLFELVANAGDREVCNG